ncbi:PurA ssDNA and RNA-binding protein [Aphelenchoides avenae]|nr:PurA ssDNA and RNA-binding protein [Aphelenchus avenae]KAH7729460.1 PurA ssDNA and RNA-binding protein [Aphelenchus avenae]
MSSESGSEGGGRNGRKQGEELATKVLNIQNKRFYLDVKQNDRGRFIKMAEVAGGGKKTRIFLTMSAAVSLKEHLNKFIDVVGGLGKEEEGGENNLIHSETINNEKRRYFLDLRENARGRFLRITQTFTPMGPRNSVAIPAVGITELRDALSELTDEYAEGYLEEQPAAELPESRSMRADNGKTFYFDPGHNDRGDYVRISEVKLVSGMRSALTVSMRNLPHFRDLLTEICDKMEELKKGDTAASANASAEKPAATPEKPAAKA